jgi:hypothetical protein
VKYDFITSNLGRTRPTFVCSVILNSDNTKYVGKVVNQLDASPEFYSVFLAQRVSGINMPIIRSTIYSRTSIIRANDQLPLAG